MYHAGQGDSSWEALADTRVVFVTGARQGREEIDLILESRAGDIAAVEVKASATVRPRDYAAIAKLREARGEHFMAGIVVYTGRQTVPLGDRMWAVPVSGLWA